MFVSDAGQQYFTNRKWQQGTAISGPLLPDPSSALPRYPFTEEQTGLLDYLHRV